MAFKFLVPIIFLTLFTISKCNAECSKVEDIYLKPPNLCNVNSKCSITIVNPYGSVKASSYLGEDILIQGKKTYDPQHPIVVKTGLSQSGGWLVEIAMVDEPTSSSFRNSVSFVSQICLLIGAAFISKKGSGSLFLWLLVAAGIFVLSASCPSVELEILFPSNFGLEVDSPGEHTYIFALLPRNGKYETTKYHSKSGLTYCTPWTFENASKKKCGGNIKGYCPSPKSCEVDPYSEVINFTCIDETDVVDIVGGTHGINFGYAPPDDGSSSLPYKNIPGFEGESCRGPLEAMGNCAAGFWCNDGTCVPATRRDGTLGYNEEEKESYYCNKNYPTGSTTWVYYLSVEHWCTLVQQEEKDVCPLATEDSSVFGGPNQMDGVARETFQINGTIPGPSIFACVGDSIEVHVHSKNMSTGTTIHWHGLWQRFNNYADGVAQVTQCPIVGAWNGTHPIPGGNWTYLMKAAPAGRTWYHSHTGLQYGDGLFGPIGIFQKNKERECLKVDNYWEKGTLEWAQWKNTWCDPYESQYEYALDFLMMNDWFHNMSSEMYQGVFFGDTNPNNYGINTSQCKHQYKGSGDFQCTHGGPTGDMPWVSGLINGLGQYSGHACGPCADYENGRAAQAQGSPECGTCASGIRNDENNPCHTCGADNYWITKVPQTQKTYRMGVVNSGQMFGLRFSIDKHTMQIISVDDMYVKRTDVQQLVLYPGQRVEFLISFDQDPNQNYWMRARTFPQQSWVWESDPTNIFYGSFVPGEYGGLDSVGEVKAVLQYNSDILGGLPPQSDTFSETFQTNGTSPVWNFVTINNPDIKAIYNPGQFAFYTAPTVEHHRIPSYYQYTATPLNQATQNRSVFVNGLMFPNYQLMMNLGVGIVNISQMGIPVVFSRPHLPVSISKGQWGLRNLTVFAGFEEFPPEMGGIDGGVGNYTHATYIGANDINLLFIQNPGPMVHPLHLHGHSFALLAINRSRSSAAQARIDEVTRIGCCRPIYNEDKLPSNMGAYLDHWGQQWYDPELSEWTDAIPKTNTNASLIIPGVSQRFSDSKPILEDPYGLGGVVLENAQIIDTVSVPPHGFALIQFKSNNPGAWFFHCHIEFHAASGMGFVYLADPNTWNTVYPTNRPAQSGFTQYRNGVGADYCCADVEFLGPNQYW